MIEKEIVEQAVMNGDVVFTEKDWTTGTFMRVGSRKFFVDDMPLKEYIYNKTIRDLAGDAYRLLEEMSASKADEDVNMLLYCSLTLLKKYGSDEERASILVMEDNVLSGANLAAGCDGDNYIQMSRDSDLLTWLVVAETTTLIGLGYEVGPLMHKILDE